MNAFASQTGAHWPCRKRRAHCQGSLREAACLLLRRRVVPIACQAHQAAPKLVLRLQLPRCLAQLQGPRVRRHCQRLAPAAAMAAAAPEVKGHEVGVELEQLPHSRICLTVTIPAPVCKWAQEAALQRLERQLAGSISGFRKGKKVPKALVIQQAGGERALRGSCVEVLLDTSLPKVLAEYKQVAISDSEKIESEVEELVDAFAVDKPLVYKVSLEVMPKVTWKAPYKDIKVAVTAVGGPASDRAEVEAKLLSLRKESGTLRLAAGASGALRPLQRGDVAIVDFDCARDDVGESIIGAKRESMQLDTDTADVTFLPGLVENMVGMEAGQTRDIKVTLPQTWEPEALRGVPVTCTVKVRDIFKWELPQLTDEFVEASFPSCGGLGGLRESLLQAQALDTAAATQGKVEAAILSAVADIVDTQVPESLVREVGQFRYQEKLLELQSKGVLPKEQLEQLLTEQMLDAFIENKRQELEDAQKAALGMFAIIQAEGLSITKEAFDAEYSSAVSDFEDESAEYDPERLKKQVEENLMTQLAMSWLQENITIEILPAESYFTGMT